ncbi:MAG: sugar nucleotide-binding protein [Pirellulales bacterium]
MERLLITGVDRPIGLNLALALGERFDVQGLYGNYAVESTSFRTTAWTGDDPLAWAALDGEPPRWIIHCPASAPAAWDVPASADPRGEPACALRLAAYAHEVGARLTVISSDVVFRGPRMFHDESTPLAASCEAATAVRTLELALAASRALIVRTHAYGWSAVEEHAGFVERLYSALAAGRAPAIDGCRHATPILATDLAGLLVRAYELRLEGVYHMGGAERTSPFRLAMELAAAFGLAVPREMLLALPAHPEQHHAAETSLNSRRARRALELTTPLLREGLARFAAQQANGHLKGVRVHGPIESLHEMAA